MLHNIRSLERMSVAAIDGDLGSVLDVCVNDDSWTLRYLVVEAGKTWLPGRKFLISPLSVRAAFWKLGQLDTTFTRDQLSGMARGVPIPAGLRGVPCAARDTERRFGRTPLTKSFDTCGGQ